MTTRAPGRAGPADRQRVLMADDQNSPSQAARLRFIAAVKTAGGSAVVARRLACSRSYVDMIRGGQRTPGMRVAFAIEREFGIRMQEWCAASR